MPTKTMIRWALPTLRVFQKSSMNPIVQVTIFELGNTPLTCLKNLFETTSCFFVIFMQNFILV